MDEIVATVLPRGDEFKKIWQNGVHGFGKDGNLIYVDRVGQVDPGKLMGKNGFAMEDVVKFHVRCTTPPSHAAAASLSLASLQHRTRRGDTTLHRGVALSTVPQYEARVSWREPSATAAVRPLCTEPFSTATS